MYNLDKIYCTDALEWLRNAPSDWINCVVTSPPYYNLRNYETEGQLGLENTPEEYVEKLVTIFREIRRVLRPDGTAWLNLADTFSRISKKDSWLKRKSLIGIPWRVALALMDDGWILRSDVIWQKLNPLPESVRDRPTKAHEYVFLLTKSERYWYDADAIAEESIWQPGMAEDRPRGYFNGKYDNAENFAGSFRAIRPTRNKRSVWAVPTEPKPFRHFAMMPSKLAETMILAGCPQTVCAECGAPYVRVVEREAQEYNAKEGAAQRTRCKGVISGGTEKVTLGKTHLIKRETIGFKPTCSCNAETRPGIVYDPFVGSGTTALVAQRLARHYIGTDINAEYVRLAQTRLQYGGDDRRMIKEIGV